MYSRLQAWTSKESTLWRHRPRDAESILNSLRKLTSFARFQRAREGGDLSQWGWEGKEGGDMAATCRHLGVEVYSLLRPETLKDWKQPESTNYTRMHGLKMPSRDDRKDRGHVGV
ncbi:hypothetical protein EYB25_000366 [Talaromyces marneffei]|nr:hypothetical protein EYB25_000366 [Talaromyces marneffei]